MKNDELTKTLSLHKTWIDSLGENGLCADLIGADLRGVDLRNVDLPLYCKWHVSIVDNQVKIGCHTKTVPEWDDWFAGKEEFDTPRTSPDFIRIRAHYEAAKAYMKVLQENKNDETN